MYRTAPRMVNQCKNRPQTKLYSMKTMKIVLLLGIIALQIGLFHTQAVERDIARPVIEEGDDYDDTEGSAPETTTTAASSKSASRWAWKLNDTNDETTTNSTKDEVTTMAAGPSPAPVAPTDSLVEDGTTIPPGIGVEYDDEPSEDYDSRGRVIHPKPSDQNTINKLATESPSSETTTETGTEAYEYDDEYAEDDGLDLNGMNQTSIKIPENVDEFMEYIDELLKGARSRVDQLVAQFLPQLMKQSSAIVISHDCTIDMVKVVFGLRSMKPWAMRMLDATGKIPEGIYEGALTSLGSYDECLETTLVDEDVFEEMPAEEEFGSGEPITPEPKPIPSTGQYCVLRIKPFLPPKPDVDVLEKTFHDAANKKGYPQKDHVSRVASLFYFMHFRLGLCIPSKCTLDDLTSISTALTERLRINITAQSCEVKDTDITLDQNQIICGIVIFILLLAIAFATTVDILSHKPMCAPYYRPFFIRCCAAFSFLSNGEKLLSTKTNEDSLKSVNGLRVMSLIWIILAHTYLTLDLKAVTKLLRTREIVKEFVFQIVVNASLAIETFFFISGLLVTYLTLKKLQHTVCWSFGDWFYLIFHRFVKITAPVMLVIAMFIFSYKFGDGPLWREIVYTGAEKCEENWWLHLLYISNFYDARKLCFLHLWYLAADMQIFIFTPIFITLLYKKPKLGQQLLIGLAGISVVGTGLVTYINKLPPTLLFNNPDPASRRPYGNLLFIKAYPHLAPYIIGMLTGYFLSTKNNLTISRRTSTLAWLASMGIILMSLFITWTWNNNHIPSPFLGAIYAAVFRVLWACAMAWLVISCQTGHAGIIGSFLSMDIFVPLSRVSYVAFLIHPGIMLLFVAGTRNLYAFSHSLAFYLFLAHLMATFMFSFILTLIIELPFTSLERLIYTKYVEAKERLLELNVKSSNFYSVTPSHWNPNRIHQHHKNSLTMPMENQDHSPASSNASTPSTIVSGMGLTAKSPDSHTAITYHRGSNHHDSFSYKF